MLAAGCPAGDDGTTNADETGNVDSTTTEPTNASTTVSDTTASTTVSTSANPTEATSSTTTANPTTPTSVTDSDSDTDETTGGLPGTPCGDFECDPTQYCDWPTNDCGNPGLDAPTCTPDPDGCPAVEGDPVCGCDGVVYADDCAAAIAGVDVDESNPCTPPPELFACGFKFCDPATSYCQVSTSDIGGFPNGYGCVPLPAACGEGPSCECLAEEPCARFSCEQDVGLTVVCPGG